MFAETQLTSENRSVLTLHALRKSVLLVSYLKNRYSVLEFP